jgi:hypothetical protein
VSWERWPLSHHAVDLRPMEEAEVARGLEVGREPLGARELGVPLALAEESAEGRGRQELLGRAQTEAEATVGRGVEVWEARTTPGSLT